jgi:hypothetical protein
MAKIVEETIRIKLSKLVSDKDQNAGGFVDQQVVETLEEAAKELIQDPAMIVEAEAGPEVSQSQPRSKSSSSSKSKSASEEDE